MKDAQLNWQKRLLEAMASSDYRPMKQHEIANHFGVKDADDRAAFRQALYALADESRIMKLSKSRWALPADQNMVVGRLTITPGGSGFLLVEGDDSADVFIPPGALGDARHLDTVRVALQGTQSPRPAPRRTKGRSPSLPRKMKREGVVEAVLERGRTQVAGMLLRRRDHWYLIPDDPRMPSRVRIVDVIDGIELQEDWRATAQFVPDSERLYPPAAVPDGIVDELLGPGDDLAVEMKALMRNFDLTQEFPEAVVEQAAGIDPDTRPETLANRMDLRDVTTITIDPADARDFDDAISVDLLDGGKVRIGIHIADVAHYIPKGSPIDEEARRRATSVYMADRVVTMLPERLTNHVCSLVPHADRLTHSVLVTFSATGKIESWDSGEAVIHSDHRFTYQEAQHYFDTGELGDAPEGLREPIDAVRKVAQQLRKQRYKEGALTFNVPEIKLVLDAEGRVERIDKKWQVEANQLIEEYMLLANRLVAQALHGNDIPTLYRVHEEPSEEQWEKMAADLGALGVREEPCCSEDLDRIAQGVAGSPLEAPVTIAMLRNLNRAQYVSERREHFGLGFEHYVHFTSPIRRYPDMIVHRGLKALERKQTPPHDEEDVAALGTHCSTQEQQAEMAEKESIRLKLMHYYQALLDDGNPGPFPGYVSGMNPRGLMVELEGTGVRGLVPFMMLGNDYYEIDRDGIRARGRSSGQVISIGDQIEVGITKVDILRRMIDFAPWSAFGKGGEVRVIKGRSSGEKSGHGGPFKKEGRSSTGKRKTKGHSRTGEGKPKAGKTAKRSGKKSGGKKRGR